MLDSTRGLTCAIRGFDAEQGVDFDVSSCRVRGVAGESFCASMHPLQRVERESVPIELLRQPNLLRDFAEEQRSDSAAGQS